MEDAKTDLGLFAEAFKYLVDRGMDKFQPNFSIICEVAIRARQRLDKYPSLYNSYLGIQEISNRRENAMKKRGLM
jgi:hypothetical protein